MSARKAESGQDPRNRKRVRSTSKMMLTTGLPLNPPKLKLRDQEPSAKKTKKMKGN
jgi:hypothetical protein